MPCSVDSIVARVVGPSVSVSEGAGVDGAA